MENPLCKYKNMFGKPNEGLRKYRIFDIAVLDTVVVILFGILISYLTGYNVWLVLVFLFVLGIIVHRLFCVRTGLDKKLFTNNK